MITPTVGQLIDFVMLNRTNKCFTGYSKAQVAGMIILGIDNKVLYYATNHDGNITGMILAKEEENKTLWIEENLAMTLSNLKAFCIKAKEQFPGYSFEGFKCRRNRKYNKLVNKLTSQ